MPLTPDNPVFTLNQYARARFGMRVTRIPLSLHHPCPNRLDGRAGCAFCLPESYEPSADRTCGSVEEQLARGIATHRTRTDTQGFTAYFQSGCATAVPVDELVASCTVAAQHPGVVAVSLATRPDCLPPDICAALAALAREFELWVELGVQTAHDRSLELVGRNHSAKCSLEAVRTLFDAGIQHVVLHTILGLPGETEEEMRESFRLFAAARPGGRMLDAGCLILDEESKSPRRIPHPSQMTRCQISNVKSQISNTSPHLGFKLHHLQVIKETPLEQWWRDGRVPVYDLDTYARLVVDILEHVPDDIVIHRMLGTASAEHLCAPVWPENKAAHLRRILDEFKKRGTWQGCQVTRDESLTGSGHPRHIPPTAR